MYVKSKVIYDYHWSELPDRRLWTINKSTFDFRYISQLHKWPWVNSDFSSDFKLFVLHTRRLRFSKGSKCTKDYLRFFPGLWAKISAVFMDSIFEHTSIAHNFNVFALLRWWFEFYFFFCFLLTSFSKHNLIKCGLLCNLSDSLWFFYNRRNFTLNSCSIYLFLNSSLLFMFSSS